MNPHQNQHNDLTNDTTKKASKSLLGDYIATSKNVHGQQGFQGTNILWAFIDML